ncbi:ectonucleotide pyrophosphatase/phosphodiesterase family member 5-like isoform X1 [Centruroides vittatus]|uniref:ectonucleotide pyrophosphatase/phosphodiesterase family member 5-like isoform X1 n=1 Tax=Centruroides vittatus TaxID=120091 RepID=UPI00350EA358
MKPSFFTKPLPNLYTIATGLYPENHGIISDSMWDPEFNKTFLYQYTSGKDPKWWEEGEPIWVTAKKQGKKVNVYNWPGSNIKIHGIYPDSFLSQSWTTPFKDEIDTIVEWLGDEEADLVLMHMNGLYRYPYLAVAERKAKLIDEALSYLFYRLTTDFLLNEINVIIVSDKGSVNVSTSSDHVIKLSDYVNVSDVIYTGRTDGGSAGLWPKRNQTEKIYRELLKAYPKLIVYKKEHIPEKFHIKKHKRCPPLLVVADERYYIKSFYQYYSHFTQFIISDGYSPDVMDLRAIFYAVGPYFKQNYVINNLDSVNIYSIICHILDIKPSAHNGSWKDVSHILTSPKKIEYASGVASIKFSVIIIFVNVICLTLNLF